MESLQKQPLPIADYLASRQGQVWTEADTEEVMRVFRKLVAKAREEAHPKQIWLERFVV